MAAQLKYVRMYKYFINLFYSGSQKIYLLKLDQLTFW